MNKIGFWINNARTIALPQSVLPALCAISLGAMHEGFCWWMAIVALLGIICAHLGFNLADDYFDYKQGSVEKRKELKENIRKGKCSYIESGKTTLKQLFICISSIILLFNFINKKISQINNTSVIFLCKMSTFCRCFFNCYGG